MRDYRGPEYVPSRVTCMIYSGQIGGEVLPVYGYSDTDLFLGLILFRLADHPLQSGVVGPHLVRGAWFPSHLLP
jgi:hypothetical protein